MKRGFKTRCEDMAAAARKELRIGDLAKLCPFVYARHLSVPVLFPRDLVLAANHLRQLTVTDSESWSGLTMKIGKLTTIVVNSSHSRARQVSTLMHELSHLILKHLPARLDISANGLLLLSDYDAEQEDEADWLAATMLLPRSVLLACRRRNQSAQEIADAYGVSEDLCNWRLRKTGVDAQINSRRRRSL